jgi:hypothetical protein
MPGYRDGVPGPENEAFMTILARLKRWKEQGAISAEQHAHLAGFCRGEPFSIFLELNVVLYAGVVAFVAGLGWTVTTWTQQLGDIVVLTVLSTLLAACSLVLLFAHAHLVPRGNARTEPDFRLRALSRQPGLVRRTRLSGEPVPRVFWAVGSLSPSERRPLLLPRLPF